jgi:hypothetical protein
MAGKSNSKKLKEDGKITFDGPKTKGREKFIPGKVDKVKKGPGSYDRKKEKEPEEDEEGVPLRKNDSRNLGTVPLKKDKKSEDKFTARKSAKELGKDPSRKTPKQIMAKENAVNENSDIINFINCIITKKYASANKYLNNAVESKIQKQIEAELETPLFQ